MSTAMKTPETSNRKGKEAHVGAKTEVPELNPATETEAHMGAKTKTTHATEKEAHVGTKIKTPETNTTERTTKMVTPMNETMDALRELAPDWDERWRADRYRVTYRIGDAEEQFSFAPEAVRAAIDAVRITDLAAKMPDASPVELVEVMGENFLMYAEYLVRLEKGIDVPPGLEELLPRAGRRALRRMVGVRGPRRSATTRWYCNLITFAFVVAFLGQPPGDDSLTITGEVVGGDLEWTFASERVGTH
jgi:hypothetical protein